MIDLTYYKKQAYKLEEAQTELLTNAMADLFKEITGRVMDDYTIEKLWEVMRFA